LTYIPASMSAGFISSTNDPVSPRLTLSSALWTVISGIRLSSALAESAELGSPSALMASLAARSGGGLLLDRGAGVGRGRGTGAVWPAEPLLGRGAGVGCTRGAGGVRPSGTLLGDGVRTLMGPPSGYGAAWTVNASANANATIVTVNMLFRF